MMPSLTVDLPISRRLLCVLSVVLPVAACGGSTPPTAQSTPSVIASTPKPPPSSITTSTVSTTTASTPAPTSTSPSGSATTNGPPPATGGNTLSACSTSKLTLAQAENYSAHGQTDIVFTLTNQATTPCTLSGYPGVSLLNATGSQVGPDATRHQSQESAVTLAPGAKAEFQEVDPQAACPDSPRGTQIRVFPPNQTAALMLPVQTYVCRPSVTPVSPYTPNGPPLIN